MIVSTRGRYALRVMLDLAERGEGYTAMKTIAERQQISLKYLERILPVLTQNGIVEGVQGKGGGYRLCRRPEEYTIGEILKLTEGDFAPVACLECGAEPCERADSCPTLPMWRELGAVVEKYFDGIRLSDLMTPAAKSKATKARRARVEAEARAKAKAEAEAKAKAEAEAKAKSEAEEKAKAEAEAKAKAEAEAKAKAEAAAKAKAKAKAEAAAKAKAEAEAKVKAEAAAKAKAEAEAKVKAEAAAKAKAEAEAKAKAEAEAKAKAEAEAKAEEAPAPVKRRTRVPSFFD